MSLKVKSILTVLIIIGVSLCVTISLLWTLEFSKYDILLVTIPYCLIVLRLLNKIWFYNDNKHITPNEDN